MAVHPSYFGYTTKRSLKDDIFGQKATDSHKEAIDMRKMISGAAAVLAVAALSAGTAFAADKLTVKDAGGNTKAVITDQGWIGLGSANVPNAIFHAKGDTSYSSQLLMHREQTTATGGAGFLAYHNNANTALPVSGDRLGYFLFGSWFKDASGNLWAKNGGGISAKAEATWTETSIPTYFAFETAPVGSATRFERLRIASDGRIRLSNQPAAPANNSPCTIGDLILDAANGYLYLCTGTNSWKRATFSAY